MTSGGDAPGLNACIRAVVKTAIFHNLKVVGIQHGYDGLISGDFIPLTSDTIANIIQLGGTILKSSRSEEFKTIEGRKKAYEKIKEEKIQVIILVGGDGSFEGAKTFIQEFDIPFIGIPKTIDNDISNTDVCIGYDTALNTAVEAIDKIRDTAESHEKIFVVEVMGRDSGFIAYGAGIACGAEAILIPETKIDELTLQQLITNNRNKKGQSTIIIVAEGDENGGGKKIVDKMKLTIPAQKIGLCVLGHIQRGGNPSAADRILASTFGYSSIQAILEGKRNIMIGINKNEFSYTPLQQIKKHHLEIDHDLLDKMATFTS